MRTATSCRQATRHGEPRLVISRNCTLAVVFVNSRVDHRDSRKVDCGAPPGFGL